MRNIYATILVGLIPLACSAPAEPEVSENLGSTQQALCSNNGQCNDNNDCTTDLCVLLACVHTPVLNCCTHDTDCPDLNACVVGDCVLHSCLLQLNLSCQNDDANCGAAGVVCHTGRSCEDGACTPAWAEISTTGAPAGRYAANAAELDGSYVISGGCTSDTATYPSTSASSYNPVSDTWTTRAPLTHGRAYHSAVTVESGTTVYGGLTECDNSGSAGLGFEKLAGLSDMSWSQIARNWDPSYNIPAVRVDTDDVVMVGGYDTTNYVLEAREGSPAVYGSWGDVYCSTSPCPSSFPGRRQPIVFFDHELVEDVPRPVVRVLGGNPAVGIPNDESLTLDIWSHHWAATESADDYPTYGDAAFPNPHSLTSGPRVADDGLHVYVPDLNGHLNVYDKQAKTWSTVELPEDYCPEAPLVWANNMLVAYSGICGGTISTAGWSYQPPAPTPTIP